MWIRVGIRYRFDVFRMDTSEHLAFMECISMLAIARMIMNACIAISIWHVETEYRMIQASPIHLHYQHMKEVFYRNYRHHISLWRSLYLCLNPCMHAISHFWKLVFDVIADIVLI